METLEREGVHLSYEEVGSGGPAMVFVHGWVCDHSYFAHQIAHFSKHHRVVSLDLRGHGASDKPKTGYTIDALADDVGWVLEELGVRDAVVVGHSMGALIAIALATVKPSLVTKAVLVDPAPLAAPPEILTVLGHMTDNMEGPDPIGARRVVIESLFIATDDPALKARVIAEMAAAPNHVAVACFRGIIGFDGERALRSLDIPALVVNAARPINDPDRLSALSRSLRHAHTPGVGHFNQLLAPNLVNELIEDFLG